MKRAQVHRTLEAVRQLSLLSGSSHAASSRLLGAYADAICSSIDVLRQTIDEYCDVLEIRTGTVRLEFASCAPGALHAELTGALRDVVDMRRSDAAFPEIPGCS